MHAFDSDLSVRRKHMSKNTVVLVLAVAKVSEWWLGGWKEGRAVFWVREENGCRTPGNRVIWVVTSDVPQPSTPPFALIP